MKIRNLLVMLFILLTSFLYSQENPAPVEDGLVVRCNIPVADTSTWKAFYLGSRDIRKNVSIIVDSTNTSAITKIAFKNSSNIPDTSTGYYPFNGSIKQFKNRNSDYIYIKTNKAGSIWINVDYINGPSIDVGGLSLKDLSRYGISFINGYVVIPGKLLVDTISGINEKLVVYGEMKVLAGGYPVFMSTENQLITLSRHDASGDVTGLAFNNLGANLTYFDSSAGVTKYLKVLEDGVHATGLTNSGKIIESKYRVTTLEYDTATVSDFAIDLDATSDTVNAFLPLASGSEGLILSYTAIDVSYPITIYANGSDLINDGENGNVVIADKYATRTFRCLNGKWRITAHSTPGDL